MIRTLSMTPPQPGHDLVLTLDIGLQQIAQHAFKDMRGAVVVMDAKDGGVLALYSNPSYDPNLFVHGISSKNYKALLNPDRPLINRTTQGRYAPASTVKPHLAILALEEGLSYREYNYLGSGFSKFPMLIINGVTGNAGAMAMLMFTKPLKNHAIPTFMILPIG